MSESSVNPSSESHRKYAKERYVLDKATKIQLEHGRTWCYGDFREINYRYYANIIWSLKKQGKIETAYQDFGYAYYRVKGVELPGKRDLVNNDRMGVRSHFIHQLFEIEGSKEPAIHDIRLVSSATGLHTASAGKGFPTNHVSKDVTLLHLQLDAWRSVRVTVHNSDSFTVLFACSNRPIICNALDVTNFFVTLGQIHEKINSLTGIDIPQPSIWQVRALHFNQDMYSGIDLPAGIVICTRDICDNLVRIYTKKIPDEPKTMVRCEVIEDSKGSKPLFMKASELLKVTYPLKGDYGRV